MQPIENISNAANLKNAFQRVQENRGCAGVDGITIEEFEQDLERNLAQLREEIKRKIYFPLPLLKILVDKGNGEARPLLIPTVRDRVAQSAVLQMVALFLRRNLNLAVLPIEKAVL